MASHIIVPINYARISNSPKYARWIIHNDYTWAAIHFFVRNDKIWLKNEKLCYLCYSSVAGFPLSCARKGSNTGPIGIQDTETLDTLDGIDIY